MSTLCVAGCKREKQRQEWQSCGPTGQSPVSRSRLKAAGGDTGAVTLASHPSQRSGVCCRCRKKTWNLLIHSVASAAQQIEEKICTGIKSQRISAATRLRRLAFCHCIRLRLGARLRLCKGPSLPTLNVQRVFFSDEMIYKCEYLQHPQNFRYWVDRTRKRMDCADLLRTDRSQFNPGIMVAIFVGWNGIASVHFVEPGVKVNSAYCCEHMLTQCHWPGILANLPVTNERYHFYADNAPNHASISTREFIRLNKPNNEQLLAVPPSSQVLNMCDYHLWKAIQDRLQPR